ncbi:MauE/DoxX family redox-associated membrane protein [Micromonospora costi]|uniref:DUF2065 family protein n=1 Tax=Micromonospora costi TaxID=1530042 RepID=A0A3B0A380_9ACTN|nr:MauE/DoxX family redox-associated membrane protein [Micromonospora costi]RKN54106.1 DUF2065 family protein [Micromonospora costi]
MIGAGLVLGLIVCATAAVYVSAGLGKFAAPEHTRRAVRELFRLDEPTAHAAVRVLALVELAAGAGLLVPAARPAAAVAAGALGLAFAAAGALGRARGTATPCGCFGRADSAPLGLRSVVVGLALAAAALAVLGGASALTRPDLLPVGAAGLTVLLAAWTWRDIVRELIRPRPTPASDH